MERDGQWTENFGLVDVDGPLFTEEGGVVSATATFDLVTEPDTPPAGFDAGQLAGTIEATCN